LFARVCNRLEPTRRGPPTRRNDSKGSIRPLRENLAAVDIELDEQAVADLENVTQLGDPMTATESAANHLRRRRHRTRLST
jgi:hypothetical protein